MKDIKPRKWARVIFTVWLFGFLLPSSSPSAQEQFDLDTCRKSESQELRTCMQTLEASFTREELKTMNSDPVNKNGVMNLGKGMAKMGQCLLIKFPAPKVDAQNQPQPNTLALGINALDGLCADLKNGQIGKFVGETRAKNMCLCMAQKTASRVPEEQLQGVLNRDIPVFVRGLMIKNLGECVQNEIAKISE